MVILIIKVDDNVLEEVKRIFDEIGMDIDRVINIFLKKCIFENVIFFDLIIFNNENWIKMLEKNVKKEDIRKVEKNKINFDEDIEELVYEGLDV